MATRNNRHKMSADTKQCEIGSQRWIINFPAGNVCITITMSYICDSQLTLRKFDMHVTASLMYYVQPTRCNVIQYSLLLSLIYMFWAVSPPIIRSSRTVYTACGMCQMLCIQFLSSWWWAEKPPETCRTVTIIKNIV
jgi:hypothetical protein